MNSIKELFDTADNYILCNTSYPLFPTLFSKYRKEDELFDKLKDISLYIHIPFCKSLCKFCEYTRFVKGDRLEYLNLLRKEINSFINNKNEIMLHGFDIGGGTPTAMTDDEFEILMQIVSELESRFAKSADYEKSIEFSISTISDRKLNLMAKHGFLRISTGIQVMDKRILKENNREFHDLVRIKNIYQKAKSFGIEKMNIDLMYGFKGQTNIHLKNSIVAIKAIMPEHVTLYETRYNMNNVDSPKIDRDSQYRDYEYLYSELISLGYKARFGQNVFTRINDRGVSSYLFHRMNDFIPYKGFGIAAQSMSYKGISYNILKNLSATELPNISKIEIMDNYILPKEEILAKYVCIALYDGKINLNTCISIYGLSFNKDYSLAISYVLDNELGYIENSILYLSRKGFRYYGAIAALFYSKDHQFALMEEKRNV